MAGKYPPPALDLGTMDYLFRVFTPFEDTCSEVEQEQRVSAVVARLGPSPGNDIFADTFAKAFAFSSMLAHGSPEQSFVPEWRSDYYAVAYRSRSWRNILVEGNQTLADFVDSQTFESPETLADPKLTGGTPGAHFRGESEGRGHLKEARPGRELLQGEQTPPEAHDHGILERDREHLPLHRPHKGSCRNRR